MKRFYREVGVVAEGTAWRVTLDGRGVKTQGGQAQLVPTRALAEALAGLAADEPERFATRFALVDDGAVALYHGDVAYDDDEPDPTTPGARHRLWMLSSGWRYERDGWS